MLQLSKYLGDGVEAWFTGGDADFTSGKDQFFNSSQQEILQSIGILPEKVFNIHQVHGARVLSLEFEEGLGNQFSDADGVVTRLSSVVLAVRTADCLPVFLYDPFGRSIGLVHAGWRSTRERIVCRAVEMMKEHYQADPAGLKVVFGPSIHSCCYEVGQEFCAFFSEDIIQKDRRWFFDLQTANLRQLESCGVRLDRVYDSGRCTCCQEGFFSYRRQNKFAGRHLSLLKLRG